MTTYSHTDQETFFTNDLGQSDPDIAAVLNNEHIRQSDEIELIASENIVSQAVLEAQGSVLTNKYAEGYPGRRYYGGCHVVDIAENLAIERAKQLFNCNYANVQSHSGSQANQAVFLSLLKPGDTYLGLDLSCGGHLTHGSPVNMSGKWFNPVGYKVDPDNHLIDYEALEKLALQHEPKLIIAGGSAYSRIIDFERIRAIADKVGAFLMADIAHIAGLIAGGQHPSPFPHAHVVTTTTHKTLRSARGAMILTNDEAISKKINSAVFPGLQGGPLMHIIAGKAVGFGEALRPSFKHYAEALVSNARALSKRLQDHGFGIVTGGTDTHIVLVDLRSKSLTGKRATEALGQANITCNMNSVPFDTEKPTVTSGIRLGTPACTTRGFGINEFEKVGDMIAEVLNVVAQDPEADSHFIEQKVKKDALELLSGFPIYPHKD